MKTIEARVLFNGRKISRSSQDGHPGGAHGMAWLLLNVSKVSNLSCRHVKDARNHAIVKALLKCLSEEAVFLRLEVSGRTFPGNT